MRVGDKSRDVLAWQLQLIERGYPLVADGVFGQRTHNATLAFQASHGLPTTGEVGVEELRRAASGEVPDQLPPVLAHSIPLVEARFYSKVSRDTIDLVVVHCMEAAETSTTAERCAHYLAELPPSTPPKERKSCHYCVDSGSAVQCVPDHFVAYGAPGANHNGLHLELAGYARQTRDEWLDPYSTRMLSLAVQLTARLCKRWKIPPTLVRATDLLQQRRGITTHAEVTTAFRLSSHTDPGPHFPLEWFVERVAALLTTQGNA